MLYYCLNCNEYFKNELLTACPHCGAVGDDIEVIEGEDIALLDNEWNPTDEELDAMHQDYIERNGISNRLTLMGII